MVMQLPKNADQGVVGELEAMIDRAVRKAMVGLKAPEIRVAAPNVQVAAPQVRVDAAKSPDVNVAAPEVEVNVDLSALAEQVKGLRADITALVAALMSPVTRTVHRGSDALIDSVTERRG